jgi:hypothetical protein
MVIILTFLVCIHLPELAMKKAFEESVGRSENAGLLVLSSPDVVMLLLACGFGTAAVGWFLIGIGALFGLAPLVGLTVYWLASPRRQPDRG